MSRSKAAKLVVDSIPPLPSSNVDRLSLLRSLPRGFRVAWIVAPAGYGKTTLMAQWCRQLQQEGEEAIWLSIRASDAGRDSAAHAQGFSRRSMQEICASARKSTTLFIDDFDRGAAVDLVPHLHELLEALPDGGRLVLASRARLPLQLGVMAVEGSALEITESSLRLNDDEARQLLGTELPSHEFAAVQQIAEGWPVAWRICRSIVASQGSKCTISLAERLLNSEILQTYLDEQVLDPLPSDVQRFILQVAIPEELTAPFAQHLTERQDAIALLDSICQRGIFAFPVESRPLWVRFHRLFRAHLRSHYLQSPAEVTTLHRKSAAWLLQQGYYAQALPHIQAVNDNEFVAQLLISSGGWCLLFRGGTMVARILHSLPLALVRSHPSLELARIYRLVQSGEFTQARLFFEELKQRTNNFGALVGAGQPTEADGLVMELLLSLYEDRTLGPQALIDAEAGLSTDTGDNVIRSAVIRELLAWSFYQAGNFHKAQLIGRESIDLCIRASVPYVQIYAYLVIGLSELAGGHVDRAAEMYGRAEDEAARSFGGECNQVIAAQVFGAEILYARNQVGTARACTEYWREAVANGDGWVDLYSSLYRTLSSALRASGDGPAAISLLKQARNMARERRLWRLDQILQDHELREACLQGNLQQASPLAEALQSNPPPVDAVQGWRVWYPRLLALARYALEAGKTGDCADLLREIDHFTSEGGGNHCLYRLERDLLEARLLFERKDNGNDYAKPLSRALVLAASVDLPRPFLDEGPAIFRLLRHYGETFDLSQPIAGFIATLRSLAESTGETNTRIREGESGTSREGILLTKREVGVLALISKGLTSKEIARQLDISINTVLTHRKNLYRKLQATTRSQLLAVAREQQMLRLTGGAAPYAHVVALERAPALAANACPDPDGVKPLPVANTLPGGLLGPRSGH